MDFYQQVGKVALGSRLRRLSDRFLEDAAKVYALYEVPLDVKWFPVFYVLSHQEEASITEIAQYIGHSHPSVSQIAKEMSKRGLVAIAKHQTDARVSVVRLTEAGKALIPNFETQCLEVAQTVEGLLSEAHHDLWKAMDEVEFLLANKCFFDRVKDMRKMLKQQQVEIVDYAPEFHDDFRRLNLDWIETYFKVEDADRQTLDHPDETILKGGGHIYMARYQGEIVGTCALIKLDAERYELAKMAVRPSAQGNGIGFLLGQSAIAKARALGAKTLCLESNTLLQSAIALYQKLGFQKVVGHSSCYERCNIQMELNLDPYQTS